MNSSIQEAIEGAKTGSPTALAGLCVKIYRPDFSEAYIDQIIPILLSHIEEGKLSEDVSPENLLTQMGAISCFAFLARRCKDNSTSSSRIPLLAENWPLMVLWMSRINAHVVQNDAVPGEDRARTRGQIVHAFMEFTVGIDHFGCATTNATEVVSILISLWKLNFLHPELKSPHEPAEGRSNIALCGFLHSLGPNSPQWCAMIQTIHVKEDAGVLARTALGHLKRSIQKRDFDRIRADFLVLNHLAANAAVSIALHSQHSVVVVTALLNYLTEDLSTISNDHISFVITECFAYLRGALAIGDCCASVIQAFDGQILCSLLRAAASSGDIGDSPLVLMTSILPKYLIFFSVLPAAWRALDEVQDLDFPYDEYLPEDMQAAWKSFKDSAELRQIHAHIFKNGKHTKSRLRNASYVCHYLQCDRTAKRGVFKRCASCMIAHYCSKEHQTAHWREQHREDCRSLEKRRKEGKFPPLSKRDQEFIRWIMEADFAHLLPEIDDFCAAQDVDKVAIEYNFMVTPPKIQYGTLTSCPVDNQVEFDCLRPEWEKALATVPPGLPGKKIFSRAYIPMGNSSLSMVAMRQLLDPPVPRIPGPGDEPEDEQMALMHVT